MLDSYSMNCMKMLMSISIDDMLPKYDKLNRLSQGNVKLAEVKTRVGD